jgi:peroxiredoxin
MAIGPVLKLSFNPARTNELQFFLRVTRKDLTMKRIWKPASLLIAGVMLTSLLAADSRVSTGSSAPQFTLQDQTGKNISLSDYAGKVVVLEWTNPECPFVQRHYKAKTMTTLADTYAKQGVVWIAINSTGSATNAADQAWITANNIQYPILNDSAGATGHAYGATSTPDMFIIDKTGKIVYDGAIDNDPSGDSTSKVNYVAKALDEVLAGKTVSTPATKSYGCAVHYAK